MVPTARAEKAPAKINLTLRVLGRRADGYHELESLVAFAGVGDALTFAPGGALTLAVSGPTAQAAGDNADNLVLKAARALAERIAGLTLGSFALSKRLPVAAGLGGGSADAAAALRLLARANGVALDDPRLMQAAQATGSDVPVCLDPKPRLMRGVGDVLSAPLDLPRLFAVLVNPGVAVSTRDVFAALNLASGPASGGASSPAPLVSEGWGGGAHRVRRCAGQGSQRSRGAGHRAGTRDCERSRRAAGAAGLPARPDVGFRRDLLRPVPDQCRCRRGGANAAGRLPAMVGACDGAGSRAVVGRPGARAHPTARLCPTGPR